MVYLALKQSQGEIITLLNDDDLYSKERLSVVRSLLVNTPIWRCITTNIVGSMKMENL